MSADQVGLPAEDAALSRDVLREAGIAYSMTSSPDDPHVVVRRADVERLIAETNEALRMCARAQEHALDLADAAARHTPAGGQQSAAKTLLGVPLYGPGGIMDCLRHSPGCAVNRGSPLNCSCGRDRAADAIYRATLPSASPSPVSVIDMLGAMYRERWTLRPIIAGFVVEDIDGVTLGMGATPLTALAEAYDLLVADGGPLPRRQSNGDTE